MKNRMRNKLNLIHQLFLIFSPLILKYLHSIMLVLKTRFQNKEEFPENKSFILAQKYSFDCILNKKTYVQILLET